jgi:hypothetical protein
MLTRYTIIEETPTMTPKQPHGRTAWEADHLESFCDGLNDGQIDQVWKVYTDQGYAPALGAAIGYKAAQAVSATPTEQGIAQLQAKIGNDDVDALIVALASLSKEQLLQMTQQIAPADGPGRTTLTDSGPQSAQTTKHYNPATDVLAAAFGSDQTRLHRLKAQTSIVDGSSDKGAALKRVSRAVASSDGLGDDSDRVVVATLDRASVHIESHVALQRGR